MTFDHVRETFLYPAYKPLFILFSKGFLSVTLAIVADISSPPPIDKPFLVCFLSDFVVCFIWVIVSGISSSTNLF